MTYICHAEGCKYTTEKINATFTHEKRKQGHKMGIDFKKFLKDPKVQANIERLKKEDDAEKAQQLKQFNADKIRYKAFLHQALKGWTYNGQGTRELLGEFIDEVAGA